ncbi:MULTISPECIES: triose-phosphate isomerase [Tenacibaculum]|uniref:Triosephosphate isomerase n=1 Tax=Tenacibaculum mesophilum TaxID=104268 RepID=A0AAE9SG66_9FLAO|nr:triose-phosphate isomerase [Tenacibaculum mesophilum]MCG7501796.1 triose-phosphate isomerase [Tenacibaculum sp. Mcav3-52]MCO7185087.1 triose-phosphate isomerase [Tenacibaculum sp. XPcli2-G]AZJ33728.1 triose-phosphate isomerase [Tenacibaculum mesophilum]QFS28971.1 triose-phosphate isomerase [Tenacibaculum mesophilum]UTD16392.1 triose-phosphate isomerase [Tenacibaculum mesophilum]
MRQKIVAGNWKMNKNLDEAKELIEGIKEEVKTGLEEGTRVIVAPSFVNLESAVKNTEESLVEVAAQNMHQSKSGAFTGEVSADMLTNLGVSIVILGHSERREYFGETDELLAQKVDAALVNGLEVIFCFGELLEDRKSGNHFGVVESQVKKALFHLKEEAFKNIILAYEPVWAIGTGETASPEQAQEMHAFVREIFAKEYGKEIADTISILYGGSVKPANAKEIFSKPDVDGGLIGGAALKVEDFAAIIKSI